MKAMHIPSAKHILKYTHRHVVVHDLAQTTCSLCCSLPKDGKDLSPPVAEMDEQKTTKPSEVRRN